MITITTHMPRFGKSATRELRTRDASGLTDEQIALVAPSVFASGAHSSRSDRYAYIPTADVLSGLRREGFLPMEVRQAGSRIAGKAEFTKHLIRFRHASQGMVQVGQTLPEIVLVNSHDGTSSYQLMSGLFRLVCSNGMIVSAGPHTSVRVPHTGDVRGHVIDGCIEILEKSPASLEKVSTFSGLALSDGEQRAFATAALQLRYPDNDSPPVRAAQILEPNRSEDSGNSLWLTMNRVQENTVRGGQRFLARDANDRLRRGKTREVKGIDGNVSLNRALWTLAEEMAKLKA